MNRQDLTNLTLKSIGNDPTSAMGFLVHVAKQEHPVEMAILLDHAITVLRESGWKPPTPADDALVDWAQHQLVSLRMLQLVFEKALASGDISASSGQSSPPHEES